MKNAKMKKVLSLLIAVLLVVGMIPATAIPVSAADDAECPIAGATGTGTEDDPVIVDTYDELQAALGYEDSELYIQMDVDIDCEDVVPDDSLYSYSASLVVFGTKTLVINGKLSSVAVDAHTICVATDAYLTVSGTGKIESNRRCINAIQHQLSAEGITIKGDLTFEGKDEYGVIGSLNCKLLVYGGTFINKEYPARPFYNDNGYGVVLFGGSFPNGIDITVRDTQRTVKVDSECVFKYADGTYSRQLLEKSCGVDVVSHNYKFGFGMQSPKMPDGCDTTHLGDYIVGDEAPTFNFFAIPLNDVLLGMGYTIEEELRVVSSESGVIYVQSNGNRWTANTSIPRDYTIYETIRLLNENKGVEKEIVHIFTLSVKPAGYEISPLGSKYNPYVVYSGLDIQMALESASESEVYIKLGSDIPYYDNGFDFPSDVIIDLNGFDFQTKEAAGSVSVQGTLTLCGQGDFYCKLLNIYGTLIIKEEVFLGFQSNTTYNFPLCSNGTIIMYGGKLDSGYIFKYGNKNSFVMYGGVGGLGVLDAGSSSRTYNDHIELYGGSFEVEDTDDYWYGDTGVLGALANVSGADYTGVSVNKFMAIDDSGSVETIDNIDDFIEFGRERFYVAFAAANFMEQTPSMPYGETERELGRIWATSYPISFNAVPLAKEFVEVGYTINEQLEIYDRNNELVHTESSSGKGIYFDMNRLESGGTHTIIETVQVKDPSGKVISEKTNTFTIQWSKATAVDEVNITINNPHTWNNNEFGKLKTAGVEIASEKWYLVNEDGSLTEKEFNDSYIAGKTYRYKVELNELENYDIAAGCTLYINGVEATKESGDTWYMDFVAKKYLQLTVPQDDYYAISGDIVEMSVVGIGDGVSFSWKGITSNSPDFTGGTTNKIVIDTTDAPAGTYEYMITVKDSLGETKQEVISLHITKLGFKEISPAPTEDELKAGLTDYGYVYPGDDGLGVPIVYFEAYELEQGFADAGYTMTTSVIDYMNGEAVDSGDASWTYSTHVAGEHDIVQKITVYDPDGQVYREFSYTHRMSVMRGIASACSAYGTNLYGYKVEVYQNGELVSSQTNDGEATTSVIAPVGDVKVVVSKNGYKPREIDITVPAEEFCVVDTYLLRWGDANLDDQIDVQDYQQTINRALSDNHKLDGSYEESVMDWAEDGYIDVLDCAISILCINGNELYSASLENDHYYTIEGATLSIPVIADGFGIKYEWTGPENGPKIVEGTENSATAKIYVEDGKGYLGNTYTYTCKVNDQFFNESILTVEVSVEELGNLYAVSYSSQYAELADQLPGRQYVIAGESITIPNVIPEIPGYQFLYWYAGSERLYAGDTYTPYQNTIIMPYMAEEYDILLYSAYPGQLFGTHLGCYNQTYVLPELEDLPEGYKFYGWTDVEDSTEVKYKAGDRYTIKGDATLYPIIARADEITLKIYANDGTDRVIYSTTLADQNGAEYFTIPEDLELPTKDGYVCTGFVDNPDSSYYGIKYGTGSTVNPKIGGIELYAYWELPNYLHFEAGMDGVSGLPSDMSFESAQSYQIPQYFTPYCEGYEFLYWEDQNGNTYNPDDYVVVNGPTILTAVWEKLDTDNYEIWIAGQKVSKANPVVQCGDGTATVAEDEWGNITLVLDNATITGSEGIRTEYNSLTIEVYGENTINVTAVEARGITGPNGNIRITGPGVLNVEVRGDDAIGIEGLYSVDYATVNVVAKIDTSGSNAYGVSCLSGSQYQISLNNGAMLNTKGTTYGLYNAGELRVSKNSKVVAEGNDYGIFGIYGIYDGWGGSSFGTVIAKGFAGAITTDSTNDLHTYGLSNYDVKVSEAYSGNTTTLWDGTGNFYDNWSATTGYKYVEIAPKACTGEHTLTSFDGLEATCDKDGLTDGEYCYTCGYVKTEREYIEAEGHDYHTHNGKAATCTEQGIKGSYTQCDNCGEYKGKVEFIDPLGHNWGEWILVEGTDTWYEESGYGERQYVRFCNNCDESDTRWHTYYDQNDKTSAPSNDDDEGGKPW